MTEHISNIRKNSVAVGTAVDTSNVEIQVRLSSKRSQAFCAVASGADHKATRRGVGMDLNAVTGQVRGIGQGTRANVANVTGR